MKTLRDQCLLGARLSGEILLDCHAHIGRGADYVIPDGDPEALASEMNRLNIRGAFVFQFTGIQTGETTIGNDIVADACRRVPGRFMGMTMVNPVFERDVLPELERCFGLGFVGIKLITHYQGYPEDGPLFERILGFAHERGLPVLNHAWGPKLESWLKTFPKVQFICGHWDPGRAELVRAYENLWVCTCLPIAHESFERGMASLRPDRVMWGSDMSDLQFGCGLGPILLARVSDAIKRRVIGLNMLELLETCGIAVPDGW
ncbi:MAG: amidohydrolase family protein [Armatimonadetes bacterium]|nr:amidohydrolase family protein [Armatimonadota bacterium]